MYIKDWFKPIFPLFLTGPLHKVKFIISMVYFAPPTTTSVIRQVMRIRCVVVVVIVV